MNFHNDTIRITNEDNMQLMARYPDKYFELAIIDPPYGINVSTEVKTWGKALAKGKIYKKYAGEDKEPPSSLFFNELRRVSKNQIIWGANHFIENINCNSSCWLVWDKDNGANVFSDCELAFTSFNTAVRMFKFKWQGMIQKDMKNKENRIHPTQKPIALYKWLLSNYAKAGDKILDTHLGSGSIAIACADLGFDLTACELDTDYFNAATKRLQTHLNQAQLFQPAEVRKLESDNSPQLF